MSEEETKKPGADSAMNTLEIGKGVLEQFSAKFREQFKIADKTIPEWRAHFKVELPQNPGPSSICSLSAEVSNKYQTAQYLLSVFDAQLEALMDGAEKEYGDKYTALVNEYVANNKKLPAAETLKALSNTHTQDLVSARVSAKICRDFFKRMVDSLAETRKSIETCLWATQLELKLAPLTLRNQE